MVKMVARVNEGVCEGCGACTAACRSRCIDVFGFTDEQIFAQLAALAPARVKFATAAGIEAQWEEKDLSVVSG